MFSRRCLSISLSATILQFKSLAFCVFLAYYWDGNWEKSFSQPLWAFWSRKYWLARSGVCFSYIFRVCRWMLLCFSPSFYTTAGHNCPQPRPPPAEPRPQALATTTTTTGRLLQQTTSFAAVIVLAHMIHHHRRPAIFHPPWCCTLLIRRVIRTGYLAEIESKMCVCASTFPHLGKVAPTRLDFPLFSVLLLRQLKTKPMQSCLASLGGGAVFSSNDQPPSSLGKCSSSRRLVVYHISPLVSKATF